MLAGCALGDASFVDPVVALCQDHAARVAKSPDSRVIARLNGLMVALSSLVLDRPVALCPKCGGQAVKMGDQPMATAQCPKCDKFHAVPWRSTDNG